MDLGAGVVGLVLGLVAGPIADRIATNAPARLPLLAQAPLSRRVLLVTAATSLLAAGAGLEFGFTLEALIASVFCWVLVVITRTDLEDRLIPNRVVLPGAVVILVARTIDEPSVGWLLAGLGAGLVLFLIALAYPRGMGMGDVKLAAFLGAGLGLAVTVALLVGFIAAFLTLPCCSSGTAGPRGSGQSRSGLSSRSVASSRSLPATRFSTGTSGSEAREGLAALASSQGCRWSSPGKDAVSLNTRRVLGRPRMPPRGDPALPWRHRACFAESSYSAMSGARRTR